MLWYNFHTIDTVPNPPISPKMLCAKRKSKRESFIARWLRRIADQLGWRDRNEEGISNSDGRQGYRFALKKPIRIKASGGETDAHRRCKIEIFEALQNQPHIRDAGLERSLKSVRPDVSAYIGNVPVAIEVQISSLSLETIAHRTREYERKGIYVLWLLQWTPELDDPRYAPRLWEKWIHAAYFGSVYYWIEGLTVVRYRFEPNFRSVRRRSWRARGGRRMTCGGYARRSKRYRTTVRCETLNLAVDFSLKQRDWWEGNGMTVPPAKLYVGK